MRLIPFCLLVLLVPTSASAQLTSDEVGILVMDRSRESRELGEYYAAARGVPAANILHLPGVPGRTISQAAWRDETRGAILAWLRAEGRESRIRCLVTCWDVPLRIAPREVNSPTVVERTAQLPKLRGILVSQFTELLESLRTMAVGGSSGRPLEFDADVSIDELIVSFDSLFAAAQTRARGLESEARKSKARQALERVLLASSGLSGLARLAATAKEPSDPSVAEAARAAEIRGQLIGLRRGLQALSSLPDSTARDEQILRLLRPEGGLVGMIRWIDVERAGLSKNETGSSLDSELAMIYWPEYSLFRWQANGLHYRYDAVSGKRPTMMVARLAAPSIGAVREMIDKAIAVEQSGLKGKVYLDARGMTPPKTAQPGDYGEYDQSLRDLAQRLRKHTDLEVVLNNEEELFQPGDCPDTALYCGWYSLGKYVDAFDWNPGAVGYHMASSEAVQLRQPGGKCWCNAMLEDGVTATLGPVQEPYLAAFPLPDDFFPLLLTGRHTIVETYYRTKQFNSWAMVLVGDPLYNPFKNNPALDEAGLPQRLRSPTAEKTPDVNL